jgi:hypothetical protein
MGSSGGIPGIPGFSSGFFPGGPTLGQGSFMPWDMGALMQGSGMPGAVQAGAPQPQPQGVLPAMAAAGGRRGPDPVMLRAQQQAERDARPGRYGRNSR